MKSTRRIPKENFPIDFGETDVLILAGGSGTRIRKVLGDTPKLLAPIHHFTYFEFIMSWLKSFGVREVTLCLGHLSEKIIDHITHNPPEGIKLKTSIESSPLGTAGAIRHAKPNIKSNKVLVIMS